jgi:hypothetical protein
MELADRKAAEEANGTLTRHVKHLRIAKVGTFLAAPRCHRTFPNQK